MPVGRADARVHGRLWPGADEVKAFVLRGPACDGDDDATCPAYLAIRDDTGTFFDAVPTCAATDQASLDVVSIFDDGPSLLVTCASLTGFGLDSDLALVHPVDGALRVVLQTRGGWGDHAPGECATPCATSCWTLLDEAHWRVIARGAAPVIETIAPIAYMERADRMVEPDTRITPNRLRWRYQPDRRRFEVERRDVDETIAIPDACAPRPLRAPLRPSR
ncbi:MAG: hypothetical protein H6709_00695 [Kofleriaceae bacterium]|nr:hypothetical protein [Kofleriaceae bacterium]